MYMAVFVMFIVWLIRGLIHQQLIILVTILTFNNLAVIFLRKSLGCLHTGTDVLLELPGCLINISSVSVTWLRAAPGLRCGVPAGSDLHASSFSLYGINVKKGKSVFVSPQDYVYLIHLHHCVHYPVAMQEARCFHWEMQLLVLALTGHGHYTAS